MIRSLILALGFLSCSFVNISFGQTYMAWQPRPVLKQRAEVYQVNNQVGGTYIKLDFKSSVDAYALVTINKVYGALPPATDSTQFSNLGRNHSVQFVNLEADTEYEVHIDLIPRAQFDGFLIPPMDFRLKTLQRHVFIALNDLFVFDDAEWDGAGSLRINVQIGDEHGNFNQAGNSWDYLKFHTQIDSGTGINLVQSDKPNYLYQFDVQSTTLKVAVTATEWDYPLGHVAFRFPEDTYMGSGSNSYNEWNSGFELIEIGHTFLTPGATHLYQNEGLVRDFEIYVPPAHNSDLSYSLTGQLVVAYW